MPGGAAQSDAAAPEAGQPAWQQLALEEYRALRGEILATLETQDGGLRFGIAALGIVITAGFSAWEDTITSTSVFLIVVPFVSTIVLTVWMGEVTRMMRAGRHIWKLEQVFWERIPGLPDPVMQWETKLRDPLSDITRWERHYEWNYHAILLMFGLLGVASIAAGFYRGIWGDNPLNTLGISIVAGAVFGGTVVGLLLLLRQLAEISETEGPLRVFRSRPGRDHGARL